MSARITTLLLWTTRALLPLEVPVPVKDELALPERALRYLPRPNRCLLVVLLHVLWLWSWVARQRGERHPDSLARWVTAMLASQVSLCRVLGNWLKATSCLVVLGNEETRLALFGRREREASRAFVRSTGPSPGGESAELTSAERGRIAPSADAADYVIVGSGAGGATVARALAMAGQDVVLLEEGPDAPAGWSMPSTLDVLGQRIRATGTITSTAPEWIPVLSGRCVGGSSAINSAIAWRAEEDVFAAWHRDLAVAQALPMSRIVHAYEEIERAIRIEATARSVSGDNNLLMERAAQVMGLSSVPTNRYTQGCEGLGRCLEGCPHGRKLSVNLTLVPEAQRHGARLYTDACVERVLFAGTRARGVRVRVGGRRSTIWARKGVVLAAGVVQTPLLMRASGLRHPLIGARFQAHPGASMIAIFDEPIRRTTGATQGYEVVHFRSQRFKPETLNLPDELLAARFPLVGAPFARLVQDELPHAASWVVQMRARSHGRVQPGPIAPVINYHFGDEDQKTLGQAVATLGRMFLAAGARKVYPCVRGFPSVMRSHDEFEPMTLGLHPSQLNMVATHLFGTTTMGGDARASVCAPDGSVHGVSGLYVADASLFPTNLGVNPQHTIMAVAQHVAWGLLGA